MQKIRSPAKQFRIFHKASITAPYFRQTHKSKKQAAYPDLYSLLTHGRLKIRCSQAFKKFQKNCP